jgi:hypothetical protein
MKTAMLETHVRRLLRASRVDPNFLLSYEVFPKQTARRRNASRRLLGFNGHGHPYVRARWPELRVHPTRRLYHTAYMRLWRKRRVIGPAFPLCPRRKHSQAAAAACA